jgi:magnesium and cobalt transporter
LEEGSEGRLWTLVNKFFRGRSDLPLDELILAAREDGEIKSEDATVLLKVLGLGKKQVADIMVPRTDIVCAEVGDDLRDLCGLIIEHGHSRIPIYRQNRDHIIGVIHAKDLLKYLLDPGATPPPLETIIRNPLFIPESKNLKDMLTEFQAKRIHIAIALDEYGGTSGLVTLEDVLEEIVGEIEDEHDPTKPPEFKELGDGKIRISGRYPLEDLREKLDMDMSSEQVETLGGFLSELAGRVPRQGESFEREGWSFTVIEANRRQVRWVLAQPLAKAESAETSHS